MSASKDDDAGFYKAEYGEPLMAFEVPDRDVMGRIRELLAELPIEPFRLAELEAYDREHAQARGGLVSQNSPFASQWETGATETA